MLHKDKRKHSRVSFMISFILLCVLMSSIWAFTNFKAGQWEKDVRIKVQDLLTSKKSKLEKALYSRIYYTRGVAAFVSLNPDITSDEYAQLAKEYIRNDTVISSMALSKDCILSEIYPIEGHESALGLNLLEHPQRKIIVQKTIATHRTFIDGPLELIEGGTAFISYTPIFSNDDNNKEHFWGVTDIVIMQEALLKEADLLSNEKGFDFALRGAGGTGLEGKVFWGKKDIFDFDPVYVNIDLPIGSWILAARPQEGWEHYSSQDKTLLSLLIISAFIISILIGLFAHTLIKLHFNEKELVAIFASLDSLIIEFNIDGEYLRIVRTSNELLYLPENKLVGKRIEDIFNDETTQLFLSAIKECICNKKLVVIEYPLSINKKERWFTAHISYKSNESVIFNATDISQAKAREQELKELNNTKDTFLSIIAHDLRGPLMSQEGLLDILLSKYNEFDDEKRNKLLITLKESSTHIYNMLENLLKWTMSQSGRIKVEAHSINIKEQYREMLFQQKRNAELKDIQLENNLDSQYKVTADINLTEVILRNLISNAIKFTPKGGRITVSAQKVRISNTEYYKTSIIDNGIGMPEAKIKKIFTLNNELSTLGTDNEKGSGLGLLLCKEFTEIQNGLLEVTSNEYQGSTFSFYLPLISENI